MQPIGRVLKGLIPGEVAKKSPSGDQTLGLDSPSQKIEIVNSRRMSSRVIASSGNPKGLTLRARIAPAPERVTSRVLPGITSKLVLLTVVSPPAYGLAPRSRQTSLAFFSKAITSGVKPGNVSTLVPAANDVCVQ